MRIGVGPICLSISGVCVCTRARVCVCVFALCVYTVTLTNCCYKISLQAIYSHLLVCSSCFKMGSEHHFIWDIWTQQLQVNTGQKQADACSNFSLWSSLKMNHTSGTLTPIRTYLSYVSSFAYNDFISGLDLLSNSDPIILCSFLFIIIKHRLQHA